MKGFFVCVLFCFMNKEVQKEVKKFFRRNLRNNMSDVRRGSTWADSVASNGLTTTSFLQRSSVSNTNIEDNGINITQELPGESESWILMFIQ